MPAYPSNCLRGLRKAENVISDTSSIDTSAFLPDKHTEADRDDGGIETSIDWEDDESVLDRTMRNHQQSAHGVARLPRSDIDRAAAQPGAINALWYERDRLPDNPHHGNLVFQTSMPPRQRKMIAASLALASSFIPRPK